MPNHESPKSKPNNPLQQVMDAISHGHVTMRPKSRFILEHIAVGAAIVLVAVGLVYVGSLLSYLWRSAQFSSLTAFGPTGYGLIVRTFPWWHALFIILGIAAFIFLLRKGTHLYRWPLAVTLGVFGLAFVVAAMATDSTHLHERLANRTYEGLGVPVIGPFYHGRIEHGLITPGTITNISKSSWTIDAPDGSIKIKITNETEIPANWQAAVGEMVVVIGEREGQSIEAISIRPAERLPHRQPFFFNNPDPETSPIPSPYY